MRILIVGGTPSHRGGVEQFCDRAGQAMAEVGGHEIGRVFSHGAYLRPKSLPIFLRSIWELFRRRSGRWDCVWLQYVSFPDLVILSLCRLFGYKVLVTPHLGTNWTSQTNPVLRWCGFKMLSSAHGIGLIAATQAEELTLPPALPRFDLVTFLPREFAARPAREETDSRRLRLVHAGRLSVGKGSFLFIDVCGILHREGHDFEAQLLGPCDAETRSRLRSRIDEAGLASRICLGGSLQERELLEVLSVQDVLVHLSSVDSYPLIVLESIGSGLYPVCLDLPGARLITASYCGHVVAGAAPAAQAAAFLASQDAGALRARGGEASRRLQQDFGWTACVAAVERAVAGVARPAEAGHQRRRSDLPAEAG